MTRLIRMRDIKSCYAWHDLFIYVTWLINVQNTNHLRARHDSLKCVTLLIQYAWHDSCMILILQRAFYLRQIALYLRKRSLYLRKIPISPQNALFFCKSALFSHKSARFDFSTKALEKWEKSTFSQYINHNSDISQYLQSKGSRLKERQRNILIGRESESDRAKNREMLNYRYLSCSMNRESSNT